MAERNKNPDEDEISGPDQTEADTPVYDGLPSAVLKRLQEVMTMEFNEAVRRAKERKARDGTMPCGVGPNIYGYNYNPELRLREVNEEEAAVVRRIFDEFCRGISIYWIAKGLNVDGIPSKRGGKWGIAVILNMLKNRSYTGVDYYGKTRTVWTPGEGPTKVDLPKSEWIEIRGFTPPLIDLDQFERVQQLLSLRKPCRLEAPRRSRKLL